MTNLKFNANAYSENPTKTIVQARNFSFIVDEPEALGGTDHGANPVEYLLGALAGCLNVVAHVVAKELGFKLNKLAIELEGDLDPARFLGFSKDNRAGYKALRVILKPDADTDQATLDNWLQIVKDRCPVSDNISNPTPIEIHLV